MSQTKSGHWNQFVPSSLLSQTRPPTPPTPPKSPPQSTSPLSSAVETLRMRNRLIPGFWRPSHDQNNQNNHAHHQNRRSKTTTTKATKEMYHGLKRELFCLVMMITVALLTQTVLIEPVYSLDIFGDDCLDNEMRKPPRFGKRFAVYASGVADSDSNGEEPQPPTGMVRYRRSPCFRGPVRRRMLMTRSGGGGAGSHVGFGGGVSEVQSIESGINNNNNNVGYFGAAGVGYGVGSSTNHNRVPISILNRYLIALASAASSAAAAGSGNGGLQHSGNHLSSSHYAPSDETTINLQTSRSHDPTKNYFSTSDYETGSTGGNVATGRNSHRLLQNNVSSSGSSSSKSSSTAAKNPIKPLL